MKELLLLSLLSLSGCGVAEDLVAAAGIVLSVGTVPVIQRSPWDATYSLSTGRDCSVVRLDEGKTYCRPVEPKPVPPPFCTHTLGAVNCWQDPGTMPGHPHGLADGPAKLTAEQEADRVRIWPW